MNLADQQVQREVLQIITGLSPQRGIFKEQLARYIDELINHDFEKLINLLYRLDVSEDKLKSVIASHPSEIAVSITRLILERQLEKIQLRQQFQQAKEDIAEEERW